MQNKANVAIIGCGNFAKDFVPLFKLHPSIEKVYVCDLDRKKAEHYSEKFDVEIIDSFEEVLKRQDISAVAVFTQRHLHGSMAIKALYAGKDVYSAVPMGVSVEECQNIIEAVKKTNRIYMMGETCIYYPCSMYCKESYEKGEFGKFVYGESQYYHDLSHFPKDFQENRKASGVPPFFYPTHSTAMILNATNAHAVKVTAFGYTDTEQSTPFAAGENYWDNEFSNEFALMRLSNGGIARVSECRRIGFKAPSSSIQSFMGTAGSYQFSNAQHIITALTKDGVEATDVSDCVNPKAMTEAKNSTGFKNDVANHKYQGDSFAPIQQKEVDRLPESYKGAKNGHMATHQFLIDDFYKAVAERKQPRVNAWVAARYTIPGLIAHESARLGGVTLDIPDFGDAPEQI